ncbi:MAG: hypothetical protein U0232_21680 [Thermomicrobiales bacterium]
MGTPHDEQQWYEIRLQGSLTHFNPVAWFDRLRLTCGGDGTTRLRGPVVD